MCPPTFFDVREAKNPHMGAPIDRNRAQQQWNHLQKALEDAGVSVELIEPQPDLDDMVFTANQVFLGSTPTVGKFVVPGRMRYPSRQKEVRHFVDWFKKQGYLPVEVNLVGEYLEGHGDLIWHPDRSMVWAGYGFRSSKRGVDRFTSAMKELGIPVTQLELVDPYFYHLDMCFCPLNSEAVLIYPGAFRPESLEEIKSGFRRVHEVSREDALTFVLNAIVVNGKFITPRVTKDLDRILGEEGLAAVVVETSEFEKSGGSVFCMKTFLE